MKRTPHSLLPAILIIACLPLGCVNHANPSGSPFALEVSAAGLPELPTELGGWRAVDNPQSYSADDLYLYINGGAVTWIECGFRRVAAREYGNGQENRLMVEIYEMTGPEAALCIYQIRAGVGGKTINLGEGGQLYDYYLEFHSGRFLVTLTSLESSSAPGAVLTTVATKVEALLMP